MSFAIQLNCLLQVRLINTAPFNFYIYSILLFPQRIAALLFYSTLLYSTLLYSTLLYSTLLYSTLFYSTLLYSTLLYSTLLYSTLIYSTLLYFLLYSTILYYSTFPYFILLFRFRQVDVSSTRLEKAILFEFFILRLLLKFSFQN